MLRFLIMAVFVWIGQAKTVRDANTSGPTAVAKKAEVSYCFERVRGNDPARQPPSYLVLQLRTTISYHNPGKRPLILPLERQRTVFSGLKRGEMSEYKEHIGMFDSAFKVMTELPADVSPDSPINPNNDVFTVIPAGGEMTPPLVEEISMPLSRKILFKRQPDFRGHTVFVKLEFLHRELSAALLANLSDRWSHFGLPWTGRVATNIIEITVPRDPPAAGLCKESPSAPHEAYKGLDHTK